MENDRQRGHDIGTTGKTVGENVARVRREQGISLKALEGRLETLERRISFSGLSKIERGDRRVDVDDLMALAIALDVAPTALLLPEGDPTRVADVTGARASVGLLWEWAAGVSPLQRETDTRRFHARSAPEWLDGSGITWHGDVELVAGIGGDEPTTRSRHHFRARTYDDYRAGLRESD
jgi:transcriptional regulator with XRE-family HTH domain